MSKAKKTKSPKLRYNKAKMAYLWPSVLYTFSKAKKIVKKNKKEPGTYDEEYRYEWVKKRVLKLLPLLDVNLEVGGIENWIDKGIVLMPNHQSYFDILALIAINDFSQQQPLAFIAKEELWHDKKISRFMSLIDTIPLDRQNPRSALAAFKEAKDLIVDYKRSMVLFPEGTRHEGNDVQAFLPAAMKLPQMANAPIVPVSFINSYAVFDPKRKEKVTVKVVFGKPIMPAKHLQTRTDALAKLVQNKVQAGIDENLNQPLTPLKDLLKPKQAAKRAEKEKAKKRNKKESIFKIV